MNNDDYQIELKNSVDRRFVDDIFGTILSNNKATYIKLVYLEEHMYEVYNIIDDKLLFSGNYETDILFVDLYIDTHNYFDGNVEVIRLLVDY